MEENKNARNLRYPRVIIILELDLLRNELQNPPRLGKHKHVILITQRIRQILLFFAHKIPNISKRTIQAQDCHLSRLRRWAATGELGYGFRTLFDMWPEGTRVETGEFERVAVEHDTSMEFEAFTDHPSERDPCEVIAHFVLHCTAAYVYWKNRKWKLVLADIHLL